MDSDEVVIVEKPVPEADVRPRTTLPYVRQCLKVAKRTAKVANLAYRTYAIIAAAYQVYHVMSSVTI